MTGGRVQTRTVLSHARLSGTSSLLDAAATRLGTHAAAANPAFNYRAAVTVPVSTRSSPAVGSYALAWAEASGSG